MLDPTAGRDAHAHHLQPEVLRVAAAGREGGARPGAQPEAGRRRRREPVVSRASLDDALSGRGEPKLPTVWFGLLAALVGALWWLVFHRYHRWTTWFIGVIPFAVVLFVFYYHLERLLPANY